MTHLRFITYTLFSSRSVFCCWGLFFCCCYFGVGEAMTFLLSSEWKAATLTHTHAHTQAPTHFLPKNRSPLKVLVVCGQGWTAGVEVDRSEQDDDADPGVACSWPSTRACRLADISPRSPSPSIMSSKGKLSPGRDIPSHTNMILHTCKHLQWETERVKLLTTRENK